METDDLIRVIGAHADPVRPLAPPRVRLLTWLIAAVVAVTAIVLAAGPRADLAAKFAETSFLMPQLALLATAVTAAFAALSVGLPDGRRWVSLLPAVPFVLWLGSLGHQCWWDVMRYGPKGMAVQPDAGCLPAIAVIGLVPAALMVAMLVRGAPFRRRTSLVLGILAAAALGDFGLRLFHPVDAAATVLVWQAGTVVLFTLLAGLFRLPRRGRPFRSE
jgi:hypothetical protein